jgi:hypothetical protein
LEKTEQHIDASALEPFEVKVYRDPQTKIKRYHITGDVPDGADLTFDADVVFDGKVGNHVNINARGSLRINKQMGDHITLDADSISARNGGNYLCLNAHKEMLYVENIGSNCTLNSQGTIAFYSADSHFTANCNGALNFSSLKDFNTIRAAHTKGQTVGDNTDISATDGSISLSGCGMRSKLFSSEGTDITHRQFDTVIGDYDRGQNEVNFTPRPDPVKVNTDIGCGIHKLSNTHYIITSQTGAIAGYAQVSKLVYKLIEEGASVKDVSGTHDGVANAVADITLQPSRADQFTPITLINSFIEQNRGLW